MGVKCIVKFEGNEQAVFLGGQILKGLVELTLTSPQKFRALRLTVSGVAQCKWRARVRRTGWSAILNDRRRDRSATFHGKELYLNSESYLFGTLTGESITFAAGVHCFNFECLLPHEMPSTNVGKYGHIGYYVKAVLDIPWAIDKEFIAPFTFIKLENLNSWPNLQAPRSIHMKKSFCGIPLICGSGALLIQATIPVGGFIPGETIPVNIQIKNTSGISIPYTTTSLQIASEFVVDTPHVRTKNVKEKTLISVKGDGFPAHFSGNVTNNLIVPAVASSNVRCSRIFKVFYNLKITCKVNGFHLSPELSIPITIGNVPFTANNVVYDAALFPATAPASAPASAPTEPLNDLPPSFADATGNYDKNIEAGNSQPMGIGWNTPANSSQAPSAPTF